MRIAVVNHTAIPDGQIQAVIRAANSQIQNDFTPLWHINGRLVLAHAPETLDKAHPWVQAEGVIHIHNEVDVDGALGYHNATARGLAAGYVFQEFSDSRGEPWEETFSHEALEMLLDPHVNRLAEGPHPSPSQGGRPVGHWYEACDAVQGRGYKIDGVPMADFVLPLYFTPDEEAGGRTAFQGDGPPSFGVCPRGYVGFRDPTGPGHDTFAATPEGARAHAAKVPLAATRRSVRRQVSIATTK